MLIEKYGEGYILAGHYQIQSPMLDARPFMALFDGEHKFDTVITITVPDIRTILSVDLSLDSTENILFSTHFRKRNFDEDQVVFFV